MQAQLAVQSEVTWPLFIGEVMSTQKNRPNGHIWMGAQQFLNAADALFDNRSGFDDLIYPIIVNYALSVELALKSTVGKVDFQPPTADGLVLAAKTKSDVRGHDLSKIFINLPADVKSSLENEFQIFTGEDIHQCLTKCRDYFVKARYPYEEISGAYDIGKLRTLAHGVLHSVKEFGLKIEGSLGRRA